MDTEFFDETIGVTGSMTELGEVMVRQMIWRGQTYPVLGQGRQWENEAGRFVLVEMAGGARFELQLSRATLTWRVRRVWRALGVV
jgi:hypothetical protein